MPGEDHRPGLQGLQQPGEVVGEPIHGGGSGGRTAGPEPAQVGGDAPVPAAECVDLWPPALLAQREAVNEDERRPVSLVDVADPDAVDLCSHVATS